MTERYKGLWLSPLTDHFRNGSCVTSVACPYGKRNFTEDEGGPFEFGNQVPMTSHRKLLSPKAMVVSVAETAGHDPVRQG
jgi:hypothetical protein